MTIEQPDDIVYIGRFRPAHTAHIQTVERACLLARKRVIILVGSANQPRTTKNPWKWDEVSDMIYASLSDAAKQKVTILPLRDIIYNENKWNESVQEIVASVVDVGDNVKLIGHSKDETSYYLNAFPQWGDPIEIENIEDLHATDIRNAMFKNEDFDSTIGRYLPKGIHDYIKSFMLTEEYEKLVEEYEFDVRHERMWDTDLMLDYFLEQEKRNPKWEGSWDVVEAVVNTLRGAYRVAPYKPTFNTTDAVVVKSGHVLLVRRKHAPGKGLYAIPGGYLNPSEWSLDGAIRELKEETKIKEPPALLKSNARLNHVFEHPKRSIRGRIITRAYIIELPPNGPLPKVTAADDAKAAVWVPLSVFKKMEDQMFEDHFHIINTMIDKLSKENA
jgi:bifunctional NMN adenylyltransferase/nudix hydrolase